MSLHTAYAVSMGFKKGTLRIEDTDVVLAVATVPKLDVEELWAAFGRDKYFRYIPVHEIASFLRTEISIALSMFPAYSGCDPMLDN